MTTKKFCDICEKEIIIGSRLIIKQNIDYEKDLCDSCKYEIKKRIKQLRYELIDEREKKAKAKEEKAKNDN